MSDHTGVSTAADDTASLASHSSPADSPSPVKTGWGRGVAVADIPRPETDTRRGRGESAPLPRRCTGKSRIVDTVKTRAMSSMAIVGTVGASFGVFGLQAVQTILLARLLGPEGRGEYGTAMFYTYALTYIGLLGTSYSIARRAAREPDRVVDLRRAAFRLGALTGVLAMIVVCVLSLTLLPQDRRFLLPLCLVASLYLPAEQMRLVILAVDHGRGAFGRYSAGQLLSACVMPALLVVAWAFGWTTSAVVVGMAATAPLIGLLAVLIMGRDRRIYGATSVSPAGLVREGLPFAAAHTASDLFGRLDTLLVIWLASLTIQGYYAAAVAATSVLIVAPNALFLFSFNSGATQSGHLSLRGLAIHAGWVGLFQLLTAVAFGLVLGPLVLFVFGAEFRPAIPLALALLPASALAGGVRVAEGYLYGRNRSSIGVWSRLAGAGVMLGGVFLLHHRLAEFSIPMAALAGQVTCIACIAWALIHDVPRSRDDVWACKKIESDP